jgi:hypothetical protein
MLHEEQQKSEHIIEEWMLTVFQNGGIERFDDLHIDRIDESLCSQQLWAGLAAFRIAVRLRDRHKLPVEVVLGFSLQSDDKKIGVDFKTLNEFTKRLDWTPPSLYLFGAGIDHISQNEKAVKEGFVCADAEVRELDDLSIFGALETGQRCLYMEFKRTGQADYCRSVLLQG